MKEINYTICPVANAAYIAANHGFLETGLGKLGYKPIKLQTLSVDRWKEHFTYENDRLFREGGNTPPIWAKSRGADVVLIGLNLIPGEQAIVVPADSPIERAEQLRGARIAVPVKENAVIDHQQTSTIQGFENVLEANGISRNEVQWMRFPTLEDISKFNRPAEPYHPVDLEALDRGEADAAFVKLSAAESVLETGKYRRIFHVINDQDKVIPVNNEYPNVLTVSRRLAEEEPEVVTEFVKQTILAAEWAAEHQKEAEALLAEQTHGTIDQYHRAYPADFYKQLQPNFAEEGLRALDIRARFLYDHGFLESRVDVYEWADQRFLKQALAELRQE